MARHRYHTCYLLDHDILQDFFQRMQQTESKYVILVKVIIGIWFKTVMILKCCFLVHLRTVNARLCSYWTLEARAKCNALPKRNL